MNKLKTNKELSVILGISDESLRFHLNKHDAPIAVLRAKKRRIIKYYDENEVREYMAAYQ